MNLMDEINGGHTKSCKVYIYVKKYKPKYYFDQVPNNYELKGSEYDSNAP